MKKLVIMMAIVLMASTASAALLQGFAEWHGSAPGSVPGDWEYESIHVWGNTRSIEHTNNGAGIVGYLGQTEVLATSVHEGSLSIANSQYQSDWWGAGTFPSVNPADHYLRYDLGAATDLGNLYLWNGTQGDHNDVSLKDFELKYSLDSDPTSASWTSLGNFQAPDLVPGADIAAAVYAMNVSARLVEIRAISSWGPKGHIGVAEVAFSEGGGPPPIPEPAGLGLVGLALLAVRRRRS